jgi:hypothetical protein
VILILIPLVAAGLGVGVWAALRGVGALNFPGADSSSSSWSDSPPRWRDREPRATPGSLGERIDQVPRGCLIAVIAAAGVWILAWLVLLVVGLSLLS